MTLEQLRVANFGKNRANATGSLGVGYTVMNISGSTVTPRTTSGVFQLASGSGIYAANITFSSSFRGLVLWDTGTAFADVCYASEQYNEEENSPLVQQTYSTLVGVSSSIETIRQFTEGRWIIDETTNQMRFYDKDNTTLVATFNLFDVTGSLTSDAVFERVRV